MVAAVLSGNRNFEGRINPQVKANYLASPPLVVAYALAGTMDIDLPNDPLGDGSRRHSRSICATSGRPTRKCRAPCAPSVTRDMFEHEYAQAFDGDENWQGMPVPTGGIYQWDEHSTYIKKPPYFDHMVDPERADPGFPPACACWRCWAIR